MFYADTTALVDKMSSILKQTESVYAPAALSFLERCASMQIDGTLATLFPQHLRRAREVGESTAAYNTYLVLEASRRLPLHHMQADLEALVACVEASLSDLMSIGQSSGIDEWDIVSQFTLGVFSATHPDVLEDGLSPEKFLKSLIKRSLLDNILLGRPIKFGCLLAGDIWNSIDGKRHKILAFSLLLLEECAKRCKVTTSIWHGDSLFTTLKHKQGILVRLHGLVPTFDGKVVVDRVRGVETALSEGAEVDSGKLSSDVCTSALMDAMRAMKPGNALRAIKIVSKSEDVAPKMRPSHLLRCYLEVLLGLSDFEAPKDDLGGFCAAISSGDAMTGRRQLKICGGYLAKLVAQDASSLALRIAHCGGVAHMGDLATRREAVRILEKSSGNDPRVVTAKRFLDTLSAFDRRRNAAAIDGNPSLEAMYEKLFDDFERTMGDVILTTSFLVNAFTSGNVPEAATAEAIELLRGTAPNVLALTILDDLCGILYTAPTCNIDRMKSLGALLEHSDEVARRAGELSIENAHLSFDHGGGASFDGPVPLSFQIDCLSLMPKSDEQDSDDSSLLLLRAREIVQKYWDGESVTASNVEDANSRLLLLERLCGGNISGLLQLVQLFENEEGEINGHRDSAVVAAIVKRLQADKDKDSKGDEPMSSRYSGAWTNVLCRMIDAGDTSQALAYRCNARISADDEKALWARVQSAASDDVIFSSKFFFLSRYASADESCLLSSIGITVL